MGNWFRGLVGETTSRRWELHVGVVAAAMVAAVVRAQVQGDGRPLIGTIGRGGELGMARMRGGRGWNMLGTGEGECRGKASGIAGCVASSFWRARSLREGVRSQMLLVGGCIWQGLGEAKWPTRWLCCAARQGKTGEGKERLQARIERSLRPDRKTKFSQIFTWRLNNL